MGIDTQASSGVDLTYALFNQQSSRSQASCEISKGMVTCVSILVVVISQVHIKSCIISQVHSNLCIDSSCGN